MANPLRGEVGFEADGKSYTLRFGTNELVSLEQRLGVKARQFGEVLADASFEQVRAIFTIGLQRHHNGTTDEAAGDVMDAIGLQEVAGLIKRAIEASFGSAEPGEAPAGTKAS